MNKIGFNKIIFKKRLLKTLRLKLIKHVVYCYQKQLLIEVSTSVSKESLLCIILCI